MANTSLSLLHAWRDTDDNPSLEVSSENLDSSAEVSQSSELEAFIEALYDSSVFGSVQDTHKGHEDAYAREKNTRQGSY